MKPILVALALLVPSLAAAGQDGNGLHDDCSSPRGSYDEAVCFGYSVGVAESLNGDDFCIPKGAKAGQAQDVVTKYLRDHPETRHQPAIDLVVKALKAAFPCQR